jgi:ABC-type transport system involved in multi-copper enzyme maturation permease subunit
MVMLSVGSLSILVSVYARTALGAVFNTYFWMLMIFPTAACLTPALSCGSLVVGPGQSGSPSALIVTLLLVFSVLQGVVAAFCCRWAVTQLRSVTLGTMDYRHALEPRADLVWPPKPPKAEPSEPGEQLDWGPFPDPAAAARASDELLEVIYRRPRRLPPVGEDALLWKEFHAEQRSIPAELLGFLMAVTGFVLLIQVIAMLATSASTGDDISEAANKLVYPWGMVLLFMLLFQVGLSAANRVSRERERQTLDGLLTLPVSAEAILFAKWLASIWSGHWLLGCLAAIWAVGVLTTGISLASLPLVIAASAVYITFIATLSLWFSTVNRTTLRSTLFTILATLVVVLGPGLLVRMGGADLSRSTPTASLQWNALIGEYALTPSATLRALTFRNADFRKGDRLVTTVHVLVAIGGLHLYVAFTGLLWLSMRARFRADKGPPPRRRPT